MLQEGNKKQLKIQDYGKLCNESFFASTKNEEDLNKIGLFLDENFSDNVYERDNDSIEGEFFRLGVIPKNSWTT